MSTDMQTLYMRWKLTMAFVPVHCCAICMKQPKASRRRLCGSISSFHLVPSCSFSIVTEDVIWLNSFRMSGWFSGRFLSLHKITLASSNRFLHDVEYIGFYHGAVQLTEGLTNEWTQAKKACRWTKWVQAQFEAPKEDAIECRRSPAPQDSHSWSLNAYIKTCTYCIVWIFL